MMGVRSRYMVDSKVYPMLKKQQLLLMMLPVLLRTCVQGDLAQDPPQQQQQQLYVIDLTANVDNEIHSRFTRSADFAGVKVHTAVFNQNADDLGTCSKDTDCTTDVAQMEVLDLLHKKAEMIAQDAPNSVVMVTNSIGHDVIIAAEASQILRKFESLHGDIVFASARECSNDTGTCSKFPPIEAGASFLSAGVFMARSSALLTLIDANRKHFKGDYQTFFSEIYVKDAQSNNIRIDHRSELFQNMDGASAEVDLRFKGTESFVQNIAFSTDPCIVFGGAHSRIYINSLGNYLAGAWSPVDGCKHCWTNQMELGSDPSKFPVVLMAIFIESATPFLEEFIQRLTSIIYPKRKIHLFVHNTVEYHRNQVKDLEERFSEAYLTMTILSDDKNKISEPEARSQAVAKAIKEDVDFFFSVESTVHFDNPYVIKLLIEQNVDVIAPLLVKPYSSTANFWGALSENGEYAEATDFSAIVEGKVRGLWNVPLVSHCYLIKKQILHSSRTKPDFVSEKHASSSVAFAANMRQTETVMYLTNRVSIGHLVSTDNFNTDRLHNELWQMEHNRWDWEQRYLHSDYATALKADTKNEQPCPDVFWFPLVTERFCRDIIETMENFGQWSAGSHDDSRLEGGYESVPTRDIHMRQVDFEQEWLAVLRDYVRPLQEKVFQGYFSDPPSAQLNFVVRYRPDEQPALRPHHDSSTYTINVALNLPHVDYSGGGCRFLRQNCSVTDTRRGWMLMHPGRLSHYHEGLPTTAGTRYILISFVDP